MAVLRLVAIEIMVGLVLLAAPQASDEQVLRAHFMPEWKLLHEVEPEYPSIALERRIQGTVRFTATLGTDGHIESLRLISAHPLLVPAARKAAQQWIYGPTLLGDKPVRVITTIDVQFRLDAYGNPVKDHERKSDAAPVL
jgi:TonB family protein